MQQALWSSHILSEVKDVQILQPCKALWVKEDTHHVEVAVISSVDITGVKATVVSSHRLPGTVQIICHQVDEVQLPETVGRISTNCFTTPKQFRDNF